MFNVRHARRAAAVLALVGLLTPGASGVVVAFHLSAHHAADHHEDGHDHAADLSVLWHGHSHETTTPQHDHPLLVAGTRALRIPTVVQPFQHAPGCWQHGAFAVALEQRVSRLCPPGFAGVGPPLFPERLSILRI